MRRIAWIAIVLLAAGVVLADDGQMLRRNVSKTPDLETEHAALTMLELYVPAQSSDGTLLTGIEYYDANDALVETREFAKPLIAFYQDGHAEEVEGTAFAHGERDAYAAVSLDDGETWKRSNLSNSADLSSINIRDGKKWVPYPGDVIRLFAASAGNKAIVVWASRYCGGGSPNYAMTDEEREALVTYMGLGTECTDGDLIGTPCLYLEDHFGVGGSQGSSNLADEGYPEVGEVPFACMWAARGTLELDAETGLNDIVWRKAERLTSGVRDANRMEVHCEAGAGCVVTWQEDPEGIRPGEGEGPGEGWSGAIAHHKTDVWYSYISWADFDLVNQDGVTDYGVPIPLAEFTGDGVPQVGVPMSIPVRLTDNDMCVDTDAANDSDDDPFCYMDLDGDEAAPDICDTTADLTITEPVEGQPAFIPDVCVATDGRLMRGNIAATRPRTNLRGYDSDGDGIYDSAWVIVAYEESKGLGEEELDAGLEVDITKVDMGKNIWYHTFDMFQPELVSQGMILNPPAPYKTDFQEIGSLTDAESYADYKYMVIDPDPIYVDQASLDPPMLYQTEIARRFSLISQDYADVGPSGTVAFAMWKQGIIRRGGPADVMARRFVVPDDFDPMVDNPYTYANMVCAERLFTEGENPRYVKGLCLDPAIGLSNTELGDCDGGTSGADCAALFPWNAYFDDIEGGTTLEKVDTWSQLGPGFGETITDTALTNLDDPSWANPYDVAKGHRGFMDGDFVMVLFAWSPNWKDNTVGHDNYNLYIRRSFDGGQTWSTTPEGWNPDGVTDPAWVAEGTEHCEWMVPDTCDTVWVSNECAVCTTYDAGAFEQQRNVSQLVGTQETILDPRYSATRPTIGEDANSDGVVDENEVLYPDDVRDPSKFFIVYETGDNTTVAEGEAEPLDLYYARAINWGDEYDLVDNDGDGDADGVVEGEDFDTFDWLEGSHLAMSGEAGVTANPGGTFFYAIWNQEDLDKKERVIGSDAWFRRVMELETDVPGTTPSGGGGGTPPGQDDDGGPGNSDGAPGRNK